MATSAFKSTSRRDAAGQSKAPPPLRRRSHSVSAASRKTHPPNQETGSISSEYSNSRDNPLFWDKEAVNDKASSTGSKANQLNSSARKSTASSSGYVSEERGRAASRNGNVKRGIGRSLSRGPKQSVVASSINGVKPIGNSVGRTNSSKSTVNEQRRVETSRVRKTPNRATELSEDDSACSLQVSNLEDEISSICFSEAEEKTIEAFCEDLNLNDFSRDHVDTVRALNLADTPPDLVNPGAVELISDIRREYAVKLEESEERARKLRADLAIEEQRGQELDKILKDILPDPKVSNAQRSRRGRRRSNERKKMSRRLNEEALTYFDECVSLSTFDSSDFSAPEDPLFSSSGATFSVGASSLANGNPSTIYCYDQDSGIHQKEKFDSHVQPLCSWEDSRTTVNNSTTGREHTMQYQYSFAEQLAQNVDHHEDISSYIKHFEKCTVKDTVNVISYYDSEEYGMHGNVESVLIDRVSFSNRQSSGHLLLCGGAISSLTFASVW